MDFNISTQISAAIHASMVGEVFNEPLVEISETKEGLHFSFIG